MSDVACWQDIRNSHPIGQVNGKRKKKISYSVLWQKILKSNVTTQTCHQKLRLHNDCRLRTVSWRQKGGDLTQSYDKSPYTHGNVKRAVTTQTTSQKSSIKQRLRTDLGRSVGVTTATQLVWLTWFTGPTFPLPATAV